MNKVADKSYNLFISYGSKDDITFVKNLCNDLGSKKNGYDVWYNKEDLESNGLSFLQNIRDTIAVNQMRVLLVIGPHSSKSDYVKAEWEFALANCMVVIPLLRKGNGKEKSDEDYDLIPEPLKKRNLDCIDFRKERPYKNALNELLKDLSSAILPLGKLYSVPNKPANFIPRNDEVEKIKDIIMGDSFKPGVITSVGKSTAVQGMGGIGKSVLTSAVCHDCDVMRSFSDGVYWIKIGQQPELTKAVQLLTGNEKINLRDNFEEEKNRLRETLKQMNCLIVLDDVWNQKDIAIFPSDGALRCRLLISTRNKQTVKNLAGKVVEVGLLNNDDSRLLLAKAANENDEIKKYTIENLPPEADVIIKECGNLPIAIAMAGGMISSGDADKWKNVLSRLQDADLKKIKGLFPDYEDYPNLFKVLEVSVTILEDSIRNKYTQLAVFPRDAQIPKKVVEKLWMEDGFNDLDTDDLLDELVNRSLLTRTSDGNFTLHDLQIDYLKKTCPNIKQLNKDFLAKLGNPLKPNDEYSWHYYMWHLKEAGEIEIAIKLLQSFEWIDAKLFATDINELLKDYEQIKLDSDTNLIYRTLKLSAHVLIENKNLIAAQLIGRLTGTANIIIKQLINRAKQWKRNHVLWMCPKTNSLLPANNLIMILDKHKGGITQLVVNEGKIISGSWDKTIRIWDMNTGTPIGEPLKVHTSRITQLVVNDGKIISGSKDSIRIWDLKTGTEISKPMKGYKGEIWQLIVSNGKIISRSEDEMIRIWDINKETLIEPLKENERGSTQVVVHEQKIISGSTDNVIRIWDINTGMQIGEPFKGHTGNITQLISNDGKIISASADTMIRIWDIDTGTAIGEPLKGHKSCITQLIVNDGKIISGSKDSIRIWDLNTGTQIGRPLTGHEGRIMQLEVYNRKIISRSGDSTIRIWDMNTERQISESIQVNQDWITNFIVNDGKIVNVSEDNTIRIYDIDTGTQIGEPLKGHEGVVTQLVVNEGKIISGSADGTIRIWNMENMDSGMQIGKSWISQLVANDGKIISGSEDSIRIWDMDTGLQNGEQLKGYGRIRQLIVNDGKLISRSEFSIQIWDLNTRSQIREHEGLMLSQLIVNDKKIICGYLIDKTIRIFDMYTGIQIGEPLEGHNFSITHLIINEQKIISGSEDSIRIWDLNTGTQLGKPLIGHKGRIMQLVVSEEKIISASADTTIRIWDVNTQKQIGEVLRHESSVNHLIVSDDRIISASYDNSIRMWNINSGSQIRVPLKEKSDITHLLFNNGKIISGCADNTIRLWDMSNIGSHIIFEADATINCMLIEGNQIIAGDALGNIHFLEPIGFEL